MRVAWLLLLVVGGCVHSASTDCGGLVCPNDRICVHATDTITVCADPGQRDACAGAGVADGETCGIAGRCYDGTCVPIACGDALVDPTEACDDGNTSPGDGCSADCASDETCGNGVVDPVAHETCDDGNRIEHDGCTVACTAETPRWQEIVPVAPDPRTATPLAYHPGRGRVVAFPGASSAPVTVEWNGLGFLLPQSSTTPSARTEHVMVYDDARHAVVLFGTAGAPSGLVDTWEWDGERWHLAALGTPNLSRMAAAYDPRGKRVIAFGGYYEAGPAQLASDETHAYDGAWTTSAIPAAQRPPGRWGAAMAYDARRGELVMFGGQSAQLGYFADTWIFDGTTWSKRMVATAPTARSQAVLFADASGLVLYGGTGASGALGDAWRWNGSTWTSMGAQLPGPRGEPHVAVDTARARGVVYGDSSDPNVYEWDGTRWHAVTPTVPGNVTNGAVAWDPLRHRAIVQAVTVVAAVDDGAWTFVGASPIAVTGAGLVWDTARDRAVLFGGSGASGPSEVTALFDPVASTWTTPALNPHPPQRAVPGMVFDAGRGVTVLVGGIDGSAALADTWEFDTAWHSKTATLPARGSAAIGYDPVRRQIIVFGGLGPNAMGMLGSLGDTWRYDGSTWTQLQPPAPLPPARINATLAWNPARRRLTLYGGSSSFIGLFDDAWEWTGDRWVEIIVPRSPLARTAHIAWPASDGSGMMIYGGQQQNGARDDQWELLWTADDRAYERCLPGRDGDRDTQIGCADPDCWWACTPLCGPDVSCAPTAPRCGDMLPAPAESCRLCPADGVACPVCGDFVCESGESATSCPGDCP